jgi:hypothetical protein
MTISLFWLAFAPDPAFSLSSSSPSSLLVFSIPLPPVLFWFFRLLSTLIGAAAAPAAVFSEILYPTNILRFLFLYLVLGY